MAWTAYPGLDECLGRLLTGSRKILGDDFFGMYLFGSLASGDFDPETSDIDFVVVTQSPIGSQAEASLARLNHEIQAAGAPWAGKLEGSFLPLALFAGSSAEAALYPTIGMGGRFAADHKDIERPLQRHMLRERGIALAGPAPATFIAPVEAKALKAEALDVLHGWWRSQLEDSVRLKRRGYQAYAVLTMCRILYTLETGGVASKPAAAGWARPRVAEPWRGLIDRALAWRERDGVDDFGPTVDLISWMLRTTARPLLRAPAHR